MMDDITLEVEAKVLDCIVDRCNYFGISYTIEYRGSTMSVIKIRNVSSVEMTLDADSPALAIYTNRDRKSIIIASSVVKDFKLF